MRKIFCLLTVLLFSSFAFGQNKPAENANKITDKQVRELPNVRFTKPKLEMQKAMNLMESYIEQRKINTSDFYLSQVRMIQYGSENDKKPAWHFWWQHIDGALGNYIEILVFMDGSVGQIPSM